MNLIFNVLKCLKNIWIVSNVCKGINCIFEILKLFASNIIIFCFTFVLITQFERINVFLKFMLDDQRFLGPNQRYQSSHLSLLLQHMELLDNQILSYNQACDAVEMKYMDSPLIKRICELAGVQKASAKKFSKLVVERKSHKPKFESAMVTPVVRLVFESLFKEQMAEEENLGKLVKTYINMVKK